MNYPWFSSILRWLGQRVGQDDWPLAKRFERICELHAFQLLVSGRVGCNWVEMFLRFLQWKKCEPKYAKRIAGGAFWVQTASTAHQKIGAWSKLHVYFLDVCVSDFGRKDHTAVVAPPFSRIRASSTSWTRFKLRLQRNASLEQDKSQSQVMCEYNISQTDISSCFSLYLL